MSWLLDMVPWWAWCAGLGVALALTAQFWWPLAVAMPRAGWAALGGAVLVLVAYLAGRNKGAAGAIERERAATEAARKKAQAAKERVRDDVDAMGEPDLDRRLDPWMRDRKR